MSYYKRIGGWLLLLGFQLILTALYSGYGLLRYITMYISPVWIKSKNINNLDSLRNLFYFETGLYFFLLIGSIIVLIKFVNRLARFRDFFAAFMIISIIGYVINYFLASRVNTYPDTDLIKKSTYLFASIIWTSIWLIYLFKSDRANNTFTN
jgi:hypothetical protein